ncbi:DUF1177 domain-containing protein [Caballeronia sp. LZ043]|uniref:DUF1177 domain-containing protein n=1 Tax=Caballeronia sp. LZ043 TaxID=3038569 RepID=UPI00285D624B|nr:DUF1177 domain-containing protein [Caballeronia sp. LZ043]MDR5822609.1 DUF1177 domain-containing protein [Caballeronia sp. LZ043]
MSLAQTLQVFEAFDSRYASGQTVIDMLAPFADVGVSVEVLELSSPKGTTAFVRIGIPGERGKHSGGLAKTLGVVGRLGGIGARPSRIGMVSDADGAIATVATALKLAQMRRNGDPLPGDVVLTTHVCPTAPTRPHDPVEFMDTPVETDRLLAHEVRGEMDAVLSLDTTKGNRVINHSGYALSPTVKEGYILRVSEDLLRIMETTTGKPAVTFPVTTQDITPYDNGVHHINSIMQPSTATSAPVVGVALTTQVAVPGCGTGASHETDIALAVKFAVEVAKEFGKGTCSFYDEVDYARLLELYGSLVHLTGRRG